MTNRHRRLTPFGGHDGGQSPGGNTMISVAAERGPSCTASALNWSSRRSLAVPENCESVRASALSGRSSTACHAASRGISQGAGRGKAVSTEAFGRIFQSSHVEASIFAVGDAGRSRHATAVTIEGSTQRARTDRVTGWVRRGVPERGAERARTCSSPEKSTLPAELLGLPASELHGGDVCARASALSRWKSERVSQVPSNWRTHQREGN